MCVCMRFSPLSHARTVQRSDMERMLKGVLLSGSQGWQGEFSVAPNGSTHREHNAGFSSQ